MQPMPLRLSLTSLVLAGAISSAGQSVPTFSRFYSPPVATFSTAQAYDVIQTRDLGYAFTGTALTSNGTQVIGHFILYKADKNGDLLWSKELALPGAGTSTCTEANGYALVEMDDSSLVVAAACGYGLCLVRTSSAGNVIQVSNHSSQLVGNENSVDMCRTPDGGVAVCGTAGHVGRILKFSASGQLSWVKTYSHAGGLRTAALNSTADSGFLLACNNGPNYDSAHIIRTDASGNELWSRTWNATNNELFVTSITPASNGGCIFTGGNALAGGFVCKLNATGAQSWWIPTDPISYGVCEDTGKALYSFTWNTNYLLGFQKIAADGSSVLWSRTFGQASPQYAGDFARTADGGFILCGYGQHAIAGVLSSRPLLMKTDTAGNMAAIPADIRSASAGASQLILYPNPALGTVNISQLPAQAATMTISDLAGRKLVSLPVKAQQHVEADVSGLAPGLYLLKLFDADRQSLSCGRFIKQ